VFGEMNQADLTELLKMNMDKCGGFSQHLMQLQWFEYLKMADEV